MNPTLILALAQSAAGLIDIWREHAGKSAGWTPSPVDWDDLLTLNDKSADDYKREAAERLGIPWPPPTNDAPSTTET